MSGPRNEVMALHVQIAELRRALGIALAAASFAIYTSM